MELNLENLVNIEDIKKTIRKTLGTELAEEGSEDLKESYVVVPSGFNLSTELISNKTKTLFKEDTEKLAAELTTLSIELDAMKRDAAMPDISKYKNAKLNESSLIGANFLLGAHLSNISDLDSVLSMDTIAFMRLERDFGSFDNWQKDFIACCMTAHNGYAVAVYSFDLRRYMNVIVESTTNSLPPNCIPVVVLNVMPKYYIRDYTNDRKSYVFGMMKELNWTVINSRFKKAESMIRAFES